MASCVRSIIESGSNGTIIDVECHLSNNLPNIIIVGFASKAVDEAKERVRSAFMSSNLQLPRKRITINLAPADIPKDSTSFDLAIAASILTAHAAGKPKAITDTIVIGELSLDGSVRPVRGIIGKILAARKLGIKKFWIPEANLQQAGLIPHVELLPVKSLAELAQYISGANECVYAQTDVASTPALKTTNNKQDFKHVIGQMRAKRALEIAAAGNHNVLLNGPPGTGKSMLAKALPSILPPLTREETLEVTHLHSLTSRNYDTIITERPFRAPHHSSSPISIVGGGQNPRPGEISLSHRGVLFLDEMPEFARTTIEALRQPLEDGTISVARAKDTLQFPASFILIATSNPCPCGYYGSSKPCNCLPTQIINYQKKLSGPIIDRIDLYIDVDEVAHEQLLAQHQTDVEDSAAILNRVLNARARQLERNKTKLNHALSNEEIKRSARLDPSAKDLLDTAATRLGISARAYMRAVKVARTIADLEQSESILPKHVSEALQYRRKPLAL